jgi:hypothetical protein
MLKDKPISTLPCMNTTCGYGWFVSQWSNCSTQCSKGIKKREVMCIQISKEGHIREKEISKKCAMSEKPVSIMNCNYGECNGNYFWRVGVWSKVN